MSMSVVRAFICVDFARVSLSVGNGSREQECRTRPRRQPRRNPDLPKATDQALRLPYNFTDPIFMLHVAVEMIKSSTHHLAVRGRDACGPSGGVGPRVLVTGVPRATLLFYTVYGRCETVTRGRTASRPRGTGTSRLEQPHGGDYPPRHMSPHRPESATRHRVRYGHLLSASHARNVGTR
ncbi:hypothetical protein Bbelb_148010 [Branchiostoma belcheri]|nr:hypothetical protein Bbelb_148010 [Branchiostoma belcheri]